MTAFRNFFSVNNFVFGKGCFNELPTIIEKQRLETPSFFVYLVDEVFKGKPLEKRIPLSSGDFIIWLGTQNEPKTSKVDELTQQILKGHDQLPAGIVGIGGGIMMDYAKAISLTLTNPGPSESYQGLDLIKNKGVWSACIPTIAGTGAEVSMTAVLSGPEKKLGIKCDYTVANQIILDPELCEGVPAPQRFYTGMDSYIHAVEALTGHCRNTFGDAYGEKSLAMCQDVFLNYDNIYSPEADEKLMVASYLGGLSLTYSQVGVCHALSYGLSHVLGTHHGLANCICFNHLEDFYGDYVGEFHQMLKRHKIELPQGITKDLPREKLTEMAQVAYALDHMWLHALGEDWQNKIDIKTLEDLFARL
ncbi:MAG: iron-containing alcohol dehydrogenase [Thiotrichaceae bacterium]|nr:iron-containing alcohol dehydrogenase [Thiotrichaceae bacterium]PCI14078.1 MAG: alcohol dehydrogenase [Thiotrichales bacterium]